MGAVCSTSTPRGSGDASEAQQQQKGPTSVHVTAANPAGPAAGLRVKISDDDTQVSNSSPNVAVSSSSPSAPIAIVRVPSATLSGGPNHNQHSSSTPEERRTGGDTTKTSGRPSPTHASTPPSGSSHGLLLQAPPGSNNTPPAAASKYAFPNYANARNSPKAQPQPQHSPSSRALASPVLLSTSDIAPLVSTGSFTFNSRPSFSSNGNLPAASASAAATAAPSSNNSNNSAQQAGGSPIGQRNSMRKSNRMSLGALNSASGGVGAGGVSAAAKNDAANLHLYPDLESFTFQLGGGITSSNGGQAESVTTPQGKQQHGGERESFTTPPPLTTSSGSNAATPNNAVSTTPKLGPQPSLHSPLTRNSLTGNPRRYSFGPNSGFTALNTTPNGSPPSVPGSTLASPLSHQHRLSGSFNMNGVQNTAGTGNTSSAAAAGGSPPGSTPSLSRTFTNNSSTHAAAQAARFRIGGSPVLAPLANNRASMGFSSPVITGLRSSPKDRPDEGGVVAPPLDLGAPSQPSVGRTRSLSNANKRYSLNMSNPSTLATSPQSIFSSELRRSSMGLSSSPVKASLVQFNGNVAPSAVRHSPTNSLDPLNPPILLFPQSSGGSISSTSSSISPPPPFSTPSINAAAPVTPTQLTFPALPSPAFSAMSTSNSMNSLSNNSAFNSISLTSMPSSANTTGPSSPNQPNGRSFVPALKRSQSEDSVTQQQQQTFPQKPPLPPQQLEPLRVEP